MSTRLLHRTLRASGVAVASTIVMAAPAMATECINLSANKSSPTVIAGVGDDCLEAHDVKTGLQRRIDLFGFDESGDPNFQLHGPIGIDVDCDGAADVVAYEPGAGAEGIIPAAHRAAGANREQCRGLVDVEQAFEHNCL